MKKIWLIGLFSIVSAAVTGQTGRFSAPEMEKIADSLFSYAAYDSAVYFYQAAAGHYQASERYQDHIRLLHRLTEVYIESDRYGRAGETVELATQKARLYLAPDDPERLFADVNRGRMVNAAGWSDSALIIFRDALAKLKNAGYGSHHYTATAYSCIGNIYDFNWDFSKAICYHTMALDIDSRLFPKDHPALIDRYASLGEAMIYNSEENNAYRHILKSLSIVLKNYGWNHPKAGKACIDLANFHFYQRNHDSVIYYSDKALEILPQFFQGAHLLFALAHQRLGYQYQLTASYKSAVARMKTAISQLREREVLDRRRLAWTYMWLSKIYMAVSKLPPTNAHSVTGARDSAFCYSNRALEAIQPGISDTVRFGCVRAEKLVFDRYLINILRKRADIFRTAYSQTGSIQYLEGFLHCIHTMLERYEYQLLHRSIRKSREEIALELGLYFSFASFYSLELYNSTGRVNYLNDAFRLTEINKSMLLKTLYYTEDVCAIAGLPLDQRNREKELRRNIKAKESEVYMLTGSRQGADSAALVHLRIQLGHILDSYDSLATALEAQYGNLAALKSKLPEVKPEDIRSILPDSVALIEIEMLEIASLDIYHLLVFVATADTFAGLIIPLGKEFHDSFGEFHDFITNPRMVNATPRAAFANAALTLYETIFGQIEDLIGDRNLVVIPDGNLCHIPFEALITEKPGQGRGFNNMPWLMKGRTVSYAHSAALYASSFRRKTSPLSGKKLLAFAPVYNPEGRQSDTLVAQWVARGENLSDLKWAMQEVEGIVKTIGGKRLTGLKATEALFKRDAPHYGIIHIATHGLLDDAYPFNSKLVFSYDKHCGEDGYLNVYELYGMELKAEMAALSACNTGFGKMQRGEGVVSLARGFAYAGVPSLVVSLWKIRDRATSIIMRRFYIHLKEGYAKDEALRRAKLDYLSDNDPFFSHPHFWAGFIHIGDTRPLEFRQTPQTAWWIAAAAVIALITSLLVFRKRSRT